jgi:hypothetical protein
MADENHVDGPPEDSPERATGASESVVDPSRRNFMKIAAAAAGAVGAAGVALSQ